MRPKAPPQQVPTPEQQEVMPATPYWQQVFPPKNPAPKQRHPQYQPESGRPSWRCQR